MTPTRRSTLLTLPLAVVGLAVSAYLTYEHYSASTTLACPENATLDCVRVTTSEYAVLLGVPVALLGLLFYVGVVALCLPVAWRSTAAWVGRARIGALTAGVGMVVYLVWCELFRIGAICLWCTVVHVVTAVLFAVVVLLAAADVPEPEPALTRR